jgi:hypothetical protein
LSRSGREAVQVYAVDGDKHTLVIMATVGCQYIAPTAPLSDDQISKGRVEHAALPGQFSDFSCDLDCVVNLDATASCGAFDLWSSNRWSANCL